MWLIQNRLYLECYFLKEWKFREQGDFWNKDYIYDQWVKKGSKRSLKSGINTVNKSTLGKIHNTVIIFMTKKKPKNPTQKYNSLLKSVDRILSGNSNFPLFSSEVPFKDIKNIADTMQCFSCSLNIIVLTTWHNRVPPSQRMIEKLSIDQNLAKV